jgi:hypothetical protein
MEKGMERLELWCSLHPSHNSSGFAVQYSLHGLQVCNIDNKKRAKELPSGVHVDLHIVAHSLTQLPLDLMDELLPNVSGGKANVPRVVFRTDGPRVLTRGSFRVMRKEDTELFKLMARYAASDTSCF